MQLENSAASNEPHADLKIATHSARINFSAVPAGIGRSSIKNALQQWPGYRYCSHVSVVGGEGSSMGWKHDLIGHLLVVLPRMDPAAALPNLIAKIGPKLLSQLVGEPRNFASGELRPWIEQNLVGVLRSFARDLPASARDFSEFEKIGNRFSDPKDRELWSAIVSELPNRLQQRPTSSRNRELDILVTTILHINCNFLIDRGHALVSPFEIRNHSNVQSPSDFVKEGLQVIGTSNALYFTDRYGRRCCACVFANAELKTGPAELICLLNDGLLLNPKSRVDSLVNFYALQSAKLQAAGADTAVSTWRTFFITQLAQMNLHLNCGPEGIPEERYRQNLLSAFGSSEIVNKIEGIYSTQGASRALARATRLREVIASYSSVFVLDDTQFVLPMLAGIIRCAALSTDPRILLHDCVVGLFYHGTWTDNPKIFPTDAGFGDSRIQTLTFQFLIEEMAKEIEGGSSGGSGPKFEISSETVKHAAESAVRLALHAPQDIRKALRNVYRKIMLDEVDSRSEVKIDSSNRLIGALNLPDEVQTPPSSATPPAVVVVPTSDSTIAAQLTDSGASVASAANSTEAKQTYTPPKIIRTGEEIVFWNNALGSLSIWTEQGALLCQIEKRDGIIPIDTPVALKTIIDLLQEPGEHIFSANVITTEKEKAPDALSVERDLANGLIAGYRWQWPKASALHPKAAANGLRFMKLEPAKIFDEPFQLGARMFKFEFKKEKVVLGIPSAHGKFESQLEIDFSPENYEACAAALDEMFRNNRISIMEIGPVGHAKGVLFAITNKQDTASRPYCLFPASQNLLFVRGLLHFSRVGSFLSLKVKR